MPVNFERSAFFSVSPEEIRPFLEEDIGPGDLTAEIIPQTINAVAEVVTRDAMVLCGEAWFDAVFRLLDRNIAIEWKIEEGEEVAPGTLLCIVSGNARAVLTGERTALNLLQTLSATASLSRRFAKAVEGTGCKVLDTRKTIPGLRKAQKYAVRCGGCFNHRLGLYDAILIKENHILPAGSIANAVTCARKLHPHVPVEVEVENLDELGQALAVGADRILLDNFDTELLREAVAASAGRAELEASGNVSLENVREISETGVDYVSVGALTKDLLAVDLSMRIKFLQ